MTNTVWLNKCLLATVPALVKHSSQSFWWPCLWAAQEWWPEEVHIVDGDVESSARDKS